MSMISFVCFSEPFLLKDPPSHFFLPDNPEEPEFADWAETNVTAQLGGSVFLHCPVINSGDRAVSYPSVSILFWHLLIQISTHAPFSSFHPVTWALIILLNLGCLQLCFSSNISLLSKAKLSTDTIHHSVWNALKKSHFTALRAEQAASYIYCQ